MDVKLKINNETFVYTEEEILNMDRDELRALKREVQSNIEEISAKRATYIACNKDGYNSKEYYQKLAMYKSLIAKLKKSISYLSKITDDSKREDINKREHWLWNFYINTKNSIRKGKFDKIVKYTDEHVTYHINVEE
jgi:hypothetical protein